MSLSSASGTTFTRLIFPLPSITTLYPALHSAELHIHFFICFLSRLWSGAALILFIILLLPNLYLVCSFWPVFFTHCNNTLLYCFLESSPWVAYKCLNQIWLYFQGSWTFLPGISLHSNQKWQGIWRREKGEWENKKRNWYLSSPCYVPGSVHAFSQTSLKAKRYHYPLLSSAHSVAQIG